MRVTLFAVCLLLAGVPALAVQTNRTAATEKPRLISSGYMFCYGIYFREAGSADELSELRFRVRQYLATVWGPAQAVVKLEADPLFGRNVGIGTDYDPTDSSRFPEPAQGVELKNAYLQWDSGTFKFRGGLLAPELVGHFVQGGLMNWEDTPAIELTARLGRQVELKTVWVRHGPQEGTNGIPSSEMVDYWSLDLAWQAAGWQLRAGAVVPRWRLSGEDWLALAPQFSLRGKLLDNVQLDLTGGAGFTLQDGGGSADFNGFAINLNLKITAGAVTLSPWLFSVSREWGYFAFPYGTCPSKTQYFWFGFPIGALRGHGYEAVFDSSRDGGAQGVINPGLKINFQAGVFDIYFSYGRFWAADKSRTPYGHEFSLGSWMRVVNGVKLHAGIDLFLPDSQNPLYAAGGKYQGSAAGIQLFAGSTFAW